MTAYPVSLELTAESTLVVEWNDGSKRSYRFRELRDACPCATCREKRTKKDETIGLLPVLTEAETRPLGIQAMKPVGSYAYSIDFTDGHNTGIYTFELLQQLGREA